MERLTKYDKDGTAIAPEFADETYIMQDDHDRFTGYINSPIVDRLAELEDKLESGRLVELPCRAGDTIYHIWRRVASIQLNEFVIRSIDISEYGITLICRSTDEWDYGKYHISPSDEDVFFDKSKAEERLKELKGGR